jgi:hypothetical protein
VLAEVAEHLLVPVDRRDHEDETVILGRRPDHRRPADVDVLDRLVERDARLRDGRLERIKIDADEVDRLDPMLGHRGGVFRVIANPE